jgi:hypothetical protein
VSVVVIVPIGDMLLLLSKSPQSSSYRFQACHNSYKELTDYLPEAMSTDVVREVYMRKCN